MRKLSRMLTLDSNVLIAALKEDERFSGKCVEIIGKVPDRFILVEPSIIYQEVCGTLARKIGIEVANQARNFLDLIIHPRLLINCNKDFYISAYSLCAQYDIYSIDAIYLKVALDNHAVLVSLDKEDFIDRLKDKALSIEAYHVTDFPY
ncbi:PIN domain-containing protein [Candidatus Bathyarchaeota archaeon]|nr:PIN domain-containing protein [Candidatus Bathyarchaeota archaeon]MBS7613154.1 PIN domain-containing protein [Candidatus Bathyarchaeota archaeon]MBS7618127.1 PIN domain-containing protein [Candidatus Bathyarchaeota archaeon]